MLELHSSRPHPQTHAACAQRKRGPSAQPAPRQNRLLAALPADDYARLRPDLELVSLPPGWTVYAAGDREIHLYFPTAGIVSRCCVMDNGASAETALTGSEGVIGVAAFLGGDSIPGRSVVLSAGYAYRLGVDLVRKEFEHDGALPHLLLRYVQALMVQTGQTAVCNRHHLMEQQLCRWILSSLDRSPSGELMMTQDLIADMLGVRRESVAETAGKLQQAGLIRYSRGHIAVLDRPRLEARACECYAVVRREYDRLLPKQQPFFAGT